MATVFHAIREKPGVSQSRLRDQTLIDRSTVSTVIANLEKAGFVIRAKSGSANGFGRPEAGLRINAEAGALLGIVVGKSFTSISIAGLDGTIRTNDSLDIWDSTKSMGDIVSQIGNLCQELNSTRSPVVGVGIVALQDDEPSIDGGRPSSDHFAALIREEIRQTLTAPVAFDVELNALALAERRFGVMRGVSNFVLAYGASTIRGALFLGDQIFRGAHNRAGEIGHVKVVPNGAECSCGARGCLNAYLSEEALLGRLAEFHYRPRSMKSRRNRGTKERRSCQNRALRGGIVSWASFS